jgi:amidase
VVRSFRLIVISGTLVTASCTAGGSTSPGASTSSGAPPSAESAYLVEEKSIATLQADMAAGAISAERLVQAYLRRIEDIDEHGPALHSVLAINPRAADDARRLDAERAQGRVRGPLHGIPVLVKDNIETADPLPTTAGSLALEANLTGRDAPIVARLREAGAIVLGKTNLSEWANIRSSRSTSGWSALGGLTRNPYALDRNACGSSSGSAAAIAASLAAVAIGTETDGSITCPASVNGLVGLKPTVGLLSRRHIVPISSQQDTAGPMARTIADAAALLTVVSGRDEGDAATADADRHRLDFGTVLTDGALAGTRLGVMKFLVGTNPEVKVLLDAATESLKAAGATIVDIESFDGLERINREELKVLLTDFRTEINAYLADLPAAVRTRTLSDLIAFNRANVQREMPYFAQELFDQAERTAGHDAAAYAVLRATLKRLAGPGGLDRLLATQRLDALIAPTLGPAWTTDLVNGDHFSDSATTLPAVAGYPHLTVPMGLVRGLPVGLSFIGPAWSDARLLAMGFAFEQRAQARRPPTYAPQIEQ